MRSLSTRATGFLILALGIWGGLVPFVAPYFHFALGPDKSWTWTSGRLYLSVIPGIVAVLAGLMLIGAGPRASARLGALLALAAGIWFAIGPDVSLLWNAAGAQGPAHGSKGIRVLEMVTYHTGLGALIAFLAGYALPRFPVVRDVAEPAGAAGAGAAGAGAAAGRRTVAREPVASRGRPAAEEPVEHEQPMEHHAGAGAAGAAAADYDRDRRAETTTGSRDYTSETTTDSRDYPSETATTDGGYGTQSAAGDRDYPAQTAQAEHAVDGGATPAADGRATRAGSAASGPVDGGDTTAPPTDGGAVAQGNEPHVTKRRSGGLLSSLRRR